MVHVHIIIEDIMEDRHAREIANAIKSGASTIAFAIWMGAMWTGCMMEMAATMIHH